MFVGALIRMVVDIIATAFRLSVSFSCVSALPRSKAVRPLPPFWMARTVMTAVVGAWSLSDAIMNLEAARLGTVSE